MLREIVSGLLLALIMASNSSGINEDGWGIDYPLFLHLQNSSYVYLTNVVSTEGWVISFFGEGTDVAVESNDKLNKSWVIGLNLTDGAVRPILPFGSFVLNESYDFRDNGHRSLNAFKITNVDGATMVCTEFSVDGPVTGAENEPIGGAFVSNGNTTLYGSWVIYERGDCGTIIPDAVEVTGEYLVNGEPTGFASKGSSRPLEKQALREQLRQIQDRLGKI